MTIVPILVEGNNIGRGGLLRPPLPRTSFLSLSARPLRGRAEKMGG